MVDLEEVMQQNFIEYASYVIVDRAIPDLRDGCKPVQRRILHTLFRAEDGKFHKVANIIGETMKLHPHGDASIGDALVVLANKDYFIEKQGNFGSLLTGHAAAASRYIECRLTSLAKETLFNPNLTTWQKSYDGRREEPVFLPSKLPVALMLGCEGIAVGMATKILPHNFAELLRAQIQILQGETVRCYPDFMQGGLIDVSDYNDGRGKVRIRALLEPLGDKKIIVRQIPFSTTTESLIASIENAIQKGKVKITSIDDFTTGEVEIELTLARGVYAEEVIPQLYAYTDCEVSISSNVVLIDERHPQEMSVTAVLGRLTEQLREQIRLELQDEREALLFKQHRLTLEQLFIEQKIYKRLEQAQNVQEMQQKIEQGLQAFAASFVRPLTAEDIASLLDLKIRRISAFDCEKSQAQITELQKQLKLCEKKLKNLTKTTIDYIEGLLERFGKQYPRRTKITTFETIDRKKVARQDLKLCYDAQTGFIGVDVRGPTSLLMSEYDLALVISAPGMFRLLSAEKKVWVGEILYCTLFDESCGVLLMVIYQDHQKILYAKKVHVLKAVRNKEVRLIPKGCQVCLVWPIIDESQKQAIEVETVGSNPRKSIIDLSQVELVASNVKGNQLSSEAVGKVTRLQ